MGNGPRIVVWTIVAGMLILTLVQWIHAMKGTESPADAKLMLYEASLFQVELLSGYMGEASNAKTTGDLDALKQAAYSVEYTHSRLRRATGGDMPELRSVSTLMELLVRYQIGGDRKLKAEENELLSAVSPFFFELYDAYADLLAGDGQLSLAAAERIRLADKEIESRIAGAAK